MWSKSCGESTDCSTILSMPEGQGNAVFTATAQFLHAGNILLWGDCWCWQEIVEHCYALAMTLDLSAAGQPAVPAAEAVQALLRQRITEGLLLPGARLVDQALAEEFGVSPNT